MERIVWILGGIFGSSGRFLLLNGKLKRFLIPVLLITISCQCEEYPYEILVPVPVPAPEPATANSTGIVGLKLKDFIKYGSSLQLKSNSAQRRKGHANDAKISRVKRHRLGYTPYGSGAPFSYNNYDSNLYYNLDDSKSPSVYEGDYEYSPVTSYGTGSGYPQSYYNNNAYISGNNNATGYTNNNYVDPYNTQFQTTGGYGYGYENGNQGVSQNSYQLENQNNSSDQNSYQIQNQNISTSYQTPPNPNTLNTDSGYQAQHWNLNQYANGYQNFGTGWSSSYLPLSQYKDQSTTAKPLMIPNPMTQMIKMMPEMQTRRPKTKSVGKIQSMRQTIFQRFMDGLRNRTRIDEVGMFFGDTFMQSMMMPTAFVAFSMLFMDIMHRLVPVPNSFMESLFNFGWLSPTTTTTTTTTRRPKITKVEFIPPKIPTIADVIGGIKGQFAGLKELKAKHKADKKKKKNKKNGWMDSEEWENWRSDTTGMRRRLNTKRRRNNNYYRRRKKFSKVDALERLHEFYQEYKPFF